ncbi:MAG: DUF2157 domain-containing protein [Alphaproteobacteria bacterium]|nr:DUF2157 domain-containing protein [Alphaproteobacteria bacterium]
MVKEKKSVDLTKIKIQRSLIEKLFAQNIISTEVRTSSLKLIYPHQNWGLWAQRLFLILGFSLILSSIIFFFAFNWAIIPNFAKLGVIEVGFFVAIICSFCFDLKKILGQISLLGASVFVGAFLAVFGQIYQTGADAYQLFLIWSLLILPFVFISTNSFHWFLWFVVTSLAIYFYCNQVFMINLIFDNVTWVLLALFSSALLVVKAYYRSLKKIWMPAPWTTSLLVLATLSYLLVPSLHYIFEIGKEPIGFFVQLGTGLSLIIHAIFYLYFRFKKPAIVPLCFTYLSLCIIVEAIIARVILWSGNELGAIGYLIVLIFTLGLFSFATMRLHHFYKQMRIKYDA